MIPRQKGKKLRYFYYGGKLHKALHISRAQDIITAWNYPDGKIMEYNYSDVRRRGGRAWTSTEVSKMINRTKETIEWAIIDGHVPTPQFTYGLDENRNKYKYMWSEEDIMQLHKYFTTVHIGRPRKDGRITSSGLPTAAELRAMLRHDTILYVKTDEGFVPTWQAEHF